MQTTLSRLRSWAFDNKNDDVRGWPVLAQDGHSLGTVDELIVDTSTQHVTQIVTGDGRHFSAHDLLVGDHTLTVSNGKRPARAAVATKPEPLATPPAKKVVADLRPREPVAASPAKILTTAPDVADIVIPIIREEIAVGTRRVDTGGLHVQSRVVSKPFDRDLKLREEQVKFERRKVDESLTPEAANQRLHDGTVEVTARSEYPIVKKRSHIVEEVVVTRAGSDRAVPMRDTLRHTEIDVNEIPSAKRPVFETEAATAKGPARAKANNGKLVIPIVDEEMSVDKAEYDTGGVRVTTRVASEPIERTVTVHEEHVTVERNAVDRGIDMAEDPFLDRAFDMATFKEEPVLTKRARVVEEFRIHKEANERVEHIHDTLRHTNVDVTQLPIKGMARSFYDDHFKRYYLDKGYKYEALVPVYEYGAELRRTMGNRDWAAVETEGKRIWEAKNPGTWDKFALAIRHGWENLTH